MPLGTLGLAFLAGILSVLSPCVLPLVPIVLGTTASEHRLGPLALAGGLAISFTTIGLFVATIGFAMGLDTDLCRTVSAILLIGVALLLLVPRLQEQFAVAAGPVSQWAGGYLDNFAATGLAGQFGLGLLLGALWSPCVGPTLGAASLLAAKGENLGQVALTMLAFGIGAALPLMLLGFLSREAMQRWRGRLLEAGKGGKTLLGVLLLAFREGLRLEFGIPIEIIEPALMQIVRREQPAVAMQLEHRGTIRLQRRMHLRLRWQLAALHQIARCASRGDVLPAGHAAA